MFSLVSSKMKSVKCLLCIINILVIMFGLLNTVFGFITNDFAKCATFMSINTSIYLEGNGLSIIIFQLLCFIMICSQNKINNDSVVKNLSQILFQISFLVSVLIFGFMFVWDMIYVFIFFMNLSTCGKNILSFEVYAVFISVCCFLFKLVYAVVFPYYGIINKKSMIFSNELNSTPVAIIDLELNSK